MTTISAVNLTKQYLVKVRYFTQNEFTANMQSQDRNKTKIIDSITNI